MLPRHLFIINYKPIKKIKIKLWFSGSCIQAVIPHGLLQLSRDVKRLVTTTI